MFGVSVLVRTCCGTLYPCYASFKAIKSNDVAQLEKWIMFWTVMGCVTVAETTAEWLVNWLPFYYQAKTVLVLWLTLPQIQGSTFVYVTYLHPFLLSHEKDIDAAMIEARSRARKAGLEYVRRAYAAVRELVASAVGAAIAADTRELQIPQQPDTQAPPHLADPVSRPAQQALSYAGSLFRTYGPAAMAAGSVLLHPMQGRAIATGASTSAAQPTVLQRSQVKRRRSELERELAELSSTPASASSTPRSSRTSTPPLTAMPAVAESFVGGQRFEEVSAEEARIALEAETRLRSGWWFRASPPKAKAD